MLIRFPHSSLVALAAAYILLPTASADTQLNVVPKEPAHARLVYRKGIRNIMQGSFTMALSLIFFGGLASKVGLVIGICGGAISMLAGLGCMVGLLEWEEEYIQRLVRLQLNLLEKVLEQYGIEPIKSQNLRDLIDNKREEVMLETFHGVLVTSRVDDGYLVKLERGEKSVHVDLVRGTDIRDEWTEKAEGLVTPEWAELIELYK